jgi:hypothetical protein
MTLNVLRYCVIPAGLGRGAGKQVVHDKMSSAATELSNFEKNKKYSAAKSLIYVLKPSDLVPADDEEKSDADADDEEEEGSEEDRDEEGEEETAE